MRKILEKSENYKQLLENAQTGNLSATAYFIVKGANQGAVVERDQNGSTLRSDGLETQNVYSENGENVVYNLGYDGEFFLV